MASNRSLLIPFGKYLPYHDGMKDVIPIVGVGVALATLMFALEMRTWTQIENLQSSITRLDDRVYELNEPVTRNQVLLEEFLQSQAAQ